MSILQFKTELAARTGLAVTGGSTWVALTEWFEPHLRFFMLFVGALTGVASLAYYALASIEKWQNVRRK